MLDSLHSTHPICQVIHGGAKGVDSLAGSWAQKNNIKEAIFKITKADWDQKGKAAGPIRNKKMLDESIPDLVLSFPGGSGTAHMTKLAKRSGYVVMSSLFIENRMNEDDQNAS